MLESLWHLELRFLPILNRVELLVKAVQLMKLLYLEPRKVTLLALVLLGHSISFLESVECIRVKLLLHLYLAHVEEELICMLEVQLVSKREDS